MEAKIVVLGDSGAGKTCLLLRYEHGYFNSTQKSTIGGFCLVKKLTIPTGESFKLQLWDTAGQERFRAMAPLYYRNASAAIVCFDITTEESFSRMKDWIDELSQNNSCENIVLAIAGNKSDLEDQRKVSRARAEQFAKKVNAFYFETSAKENFGVEELFQKVSEEIIARKRFSISEKADSISQPSRDVTSLPTKLTSESYKSRRRKCC